MLLAVSVSRFEAKSSYKMILLEVSEIIVSTATVVNAKINPSVGLFVMTAKSTFSCKIKESATSNTGYSKVAQQKCV